jgi:uncharacterized protein
MSDMAASLRQRLSGDLLLAMKAKDTIAISALRSLLSALDNASAVPASTVAAPVFGGNGDVPRRELTDTDCQRIISAEVSTRSVASVISDSEHACCCARPTHQSAIRSNNFVHKCKAT